MSPALRKLLPFAVIALAGVAGVFAWKSRMLSRETATELPPVARQLPKSPRQSVLPHLAPLADPGQSWQSRIELLRTSLRTECGERELRSLYELLAAGPPKGELPEHWYIIANEYMEQALRNDPDYQRFSSTLLRVLHDPMQPLVVRDYAVQHLVTWLNPRSRQTLAAHSNPAKTADQPSPEIATRVLQALVVAATDPALEQSTIPGTTLMMVVKLVRFPGDIDCSQAVATLKPWLAKALQDGSTVSTPVRVSAVQAAGVLAPQEFRPVLRQIAYQETGQSSLRLPSIAALAHCGETADIEKLQQIVSSRPELSYAAREAIRILTARLAQAGSTPRSN
jgi:hypothetical protein